MTNLIRKACSMLFGEDPNCQDTLILQPGNSNPSGGNSGIPLNDTSDGLPLNILAFRTITMLLAKIQQERPLISNSLQCIGQQDSQ
ncbi:hypothetical protein BYT27DRAFT_7189252 [Phlegmacium glaucopus]|nr:hypothetical protein BYT27DRAFT_7189252 [Phlegmacium glaucopus]